MFCRQPFFNAFCCSIEFEFELVICFNNRSCIKTVALKPICTVQDE